MGVLNAVLMVVLLALLGGTGYALMVVLCLRLRNPVLRRIELSELPPEIMEALRGLAEEVRDEGLTLAALQHEQRSTGDSSWGAINYDSTRTTWAVATFHRTLFTNEQCINLALYSRLANGNVIVTARHNPAAFVAPEPWRMTRSAFETVRAQWETHQESIRSYGGTDKIERFADFEEFREWSQQQGESELDALWNKKSLVITGDGAYRFSPAKLHGALWQGMVELAFWVRAKAGPWTLAAKSKLVAWSGLAQAKVVEGYGIAKCKTRSWMESRRRSTSSGGQGEVPGKEPSSESRVGADPVEPATRGDVPEPQRESASVASLPPIIEAQVAQASQSAPVPEASGAMTASSPALEVEPPVPGECPIDCPHLRSRQVSAPPQELAGAAHPAAVQGPYVPQGFGSLMPAEAELASTPTVPKSRIEKYREKRSRMTLPRLLGWSVQGMLQGAALAALLLVLASQGMINDASWLLIAAVIVLHELGHALMTKATGFRHPAVFVLPVLGWLATGRKTCVSPRKAFWTELMGPLPGLLAGWGILVWNHLAPGQPAWLLDGAFWAVLLNSFFLLPINPFDGGRIADLVFFNRHPYLRVAYYFCMGVGLTALYFVSPILLVIPIVVLAQVPGALRTRRLTKAIRQAIHTVEPEEKALLKTFKIVEQTGNQKLYKRLAWTSTIDRLLRIAGSQRFGFFSRTCGAGVHMVLLFLPVIALVAYALTLRLDQEQELEGASARMAVLEQQVRWIGVAPDSVNRRILEKIEAAGGAPASLQHKVNQLLVNFGVVEGAAGGGVLTPGKRVEALRLARQLNWTQVGSWIAEDEDKSRSRRALVTSIISGLVESAESGAERGDFETVGNELGVAYWAIISCEPRQSFMEWRRWSQLESEVLVALEDLCAAQPLAEDKRAWFLRALSQAPRPEGPKLALLLLRDLADESVIPGHAYDWQELMGRADQNGNRVWNPDSSAGQAELAADPPLRLKESGLPIPGETPMLSPRARVSATVHHYMSPLLGAERFPAGFKVADQWSAESLATVVPGGEGEMLHGIESWNHRLRPILRVTGHRQVVATALGDSPRAPVNRELAGHGQE